MSGNGARPENARAAQSPPGQPPGAGWRVVGESVQGVAHVRAGLPNQDALLWWLPPSGYGPPAIAAIADGHGGASHFRSEIGARFAVQVATATLRDFLSNRREDGAREALEADSGALPQQIAEAWQAEVLHHLEENPFTAEEWEKLSATPSAAARTLVEAHPALAYGATLLAVLVADSFLLYLQLGDGDILAVDSAGVTSRPVPGDSRLVANQTTSLSQPEAWKDFRLALDAQQAPRPALILLSTDGYANAFRSDEDFLQIGGDYLAMARQGGLEKVSGQLKEFLLDASRNGSGDDITLALVRREEEPQEAHAIREEEGESQRREAVAERESKLPPSQEVSVPEPPPPVVRRSTTSPVTRAIEIVAVLLALGLGAFFVLRHFAPRPPIKTARPVPRPVRVTTKPVVRLGIRVGAGKTIPLAAGVQLMGRQVGLRGPAAQEVVAEAGEPGRAGAFTLLNDSKLTWSVVFPGGRKAGIKTQQSVPIAQGMRIRFGPGAPAVDVVKVGKE